MTDRDAYWRGLFNTASLKIAVMSDDRKHRYWLTRIWDRARPFLVVCMFNPSTADERKDDQTILRLCGWASRWGYGGLLVVNLYSIRTSDPTHVQGREREAFGDAQPHAWAAAIDIAKEQGTPILCAWGALASPGADFPFLSAAAGVELICLGLTNARRPKHPMARGRSRVPDDQQPLAYEPI